MTSKWREKCPRKSITVGKNPCKVGIPSEEIILGEKTNSLAKGDDEGSSKAFQSNCYRHGRVMKEWVPKLEAALKLMNKPMGEQQRL